MHSGGTAGFLHWGICIPQDIIKTIQQCHDGPVPLKYMDVFRQLKNEGGIARFYRGAGVTVTRGYMMNAAILPIYDYISEWLNLKL